MRTQNEKSITRRSFLIWAAMVLTLFSAAQCFGQKEESEAKRATNRDGLAETGYMTKAEVIDEIEGTEDEYFYKFKARPGKLTVIVEVSANETNAGVMLDLFGPNSKAIISNMLVQAANRGTERVSQSVKLIKAQDVVIRIKGLKYGSSAAYPGTYKILLEGPAVNFEEVPSSEGAVEVKKPVAGKSLTTINAVGN